MSEQITIGKSIKPHVFHRPFVDQLQEWSECVHCKMSTRFPEYYRQEQCPGRAP